MIWILMNNDSCETKGSTTFYFLTYQTQSWKWVRQEYGYPLVGRGLLRGHLRVQRPQCQGWSDPLWPPPVNKGNNSVTPSKSIVDIYTFSYLPFKLMAVMLSCATWGSMIHFNPYRYYFCHYFILRSKEMTCYYHIIARVMLFWGGSSRL